MWKVYRIDIFESDVSYIVDLEQLFLIAILLNILRVNGAEISSAYDLSLKKAPCSSRVERTDENSLESSVRRLHLAVRRRRWQIKGKASRHFGAKREVISAARPGKSACCVRFLCQVLLAKELFN